jgi:peptidoglycan/LPS O-acetylase OafA/YrhL
VQGSARSSGYRADIDGLRAVAVLAVLGFHAFPGHVPGGFLGVDIFFVLSGYLITGLLLAETARGSFTLADFYARRIRRLFPAAITVVAAICTAGYLLLFSHEFARLARHAWASLFFVENMLLASETGYFDVAAASKPLLHFWSLAVEEQFYLFWPVMLVPLARKPWAAAALIAAVLIGSLAIVLAGDPGTAWHFYSPLTRAWELAMGAALACYGRLYRLPLLANAPRLADAVSILALALLAGAILIGPRGHAHPGWITIIPVAATMALLATGPAALVNRRLLAMRPAIAIGLISYPLYLWHWPLLSYTLVVTGERGSTGLRMMLLAIAFGLAWATWRWIERPLRFSWPARRAVTVLVGAALLLALAIFAAVQLRPAQTDRTHAVAEEQLEGVAWRYTANELCRQRHPQHFTAFCMQQGDADPVILFAGNSYANHLFPGIATHPRFAGVPMLAFGNCELSRRFPFGIYGKDQCEDQLRMAARYASVELIVVGNQWSLFDVQGRMTDLQAGDPGKPSDYPDARGYRGGLRQTFALLARRRVPVVIFGPKPELGYDIASCYGRPLRPATRSCTIDRATFEQQAAVTVEMLRGIAAEFPNVHYFDLAPLFCDAVKCTYRAPDGAPLLRDGNGHFSVLGSRYVADRFVRWADANGVRLPRR